ncbi:hypothetical protein HYT57_03430 [Candidatus Woesearchaeota archaeon]|nr:hypothetical protein [Candidatus Woesearchaeota archaeon]
MNFLFVSHYSDFYRKILPQFLEKGVNLGFSGSIEKTTQLLRTRKDYGCIILHYNPEDHPEMYGISLLEHLILTGQTFHRDYTRIISVISIDETNFFERAFELYVQTIVLRLIQEQEVQT